MSDIAIFDLIDFRHWIPIVSGWFCREPHVHPDDHAPSHADLDEWLQSGRLRIVLVAEVDGELAGTVALQDRPQEGSPWIAGLYVLPGFRRRGVGTHLLRAAENRARAIGLGKVYLYTPRCADFYGAFGWRPCEGAAEFTGTAAILEKCLTPHSLFQPDPPALRG